MFGKLQLCLNVAIVLLCMRFADAVGSADIILAPAIGGLADEAARNAMNIDDGVVMPVFMVNGFQYSPALAWKQKAFLMN